jgi:N utilization substance protein A
MRTKVAVASDRDDVDSVGACVGMKGIRIQSIVRELEGEKIDVVAYYEDKKIMAANALTPAKVKEVVQTSGGGVIAVVDNDQYSLAVGRAGHNVRLASRLCGFDIDIKTEETYQTFLGSSESRSIVEQLFSTNETDETPLEELVDLEPRIIKILEKAGIFSVEDLVERSIDDLMKIEGIGEKTAQRILEIISDAVDFEDGEDSEADGDSPDEDHV